MGTDTDFLWSEAILNDDERAAVGAVVIESTRLDDLLEAFIWTALALDGEDGLAVTRRMAFLNKLEMVKELLNRKWPSAGREFAEKEGGLYVRMKAANDDRRTIVHGLWGLTPGAEIRNYLRALIMKERGELEASVHIKTRPGVTVKSSQLRTVAVALHRLQEEFKDFALRHGLV